MVKDVQSRKAASVKERLTSFIGVILIMGLCMAGMITSMVSYKGEEDEFFIVTHENILKGDIFVLDAEDRLIYGLDLDKSLQGKGSSAIMSKLPLLDRNGNEITARPLGMTINGWGEIYVSFDDSSITRYQYPMMYNKQYPWDLPPDEEFALNPETFALPRNAIRLASTWDSMELEPDWIIDNSPINVDNIIAYISDEDNGATNNMVYLLDTNMVEISSFSVEDPPRPDAISSEDGDDERGSYPLTGISLTPTMHDSTWFDAFENPGWSNFYYDMSDFNIAMSSSAPQSFSMMNPRADDPMDAYFGPDLEYPYISVETPLSHDDPETDPLDFALDTIFPYKFLEEYMTGEMFTVFRNGQTIGIKRGERMYENSYWPSHNTTDPAYYDFSGAPHFPLKLTWGEGMYEDPPHSDKAVIDPSMASFNILSFREDCPATTFYLYPAPTTYTGEGEPPIGSNPALPYDYYSIPDVDPYTLAPYEAIGLSSLNWPATYSPRIELWSDADDPPVKPNHIVIPTEGSWKIKANNDPASSDYPGNDDVVNMKDAFTEYLEDGGDPYYHSYYYEVEHGQTYLGTDPVTGARYLGNFILTDAPGNSEFELPAEISDPQDIAVPRGLKPEATISGLVFSQDRNGNPLRLKDVSVKVTVKDMTFPFSTNTYSTYTDDEGKYSITVGSFSPNFQYNITVTLVDREGLIPIHCQDGYNNEIAYLKTSLFETDQKRTVRNIFYSGVTGTIDPTMTVGMKNVMHDCGVCYYFTHKALTYTREELGLENDHNLPIDTYLYSPTDGVYYSVSSSFINIQKKNGDSKFTDNEVPVNREYHEFGHHVHTDSSMGGDNMLAPNSGEDQNHGGVDNSDSNDSVAEGFAEFFSLMVNGSSMYVNTDLERNFFLKNATSGKPYEEYNVASLLWDIVDNDVEPGDNLNLPIKEFWDNILNHESISTVLSLYEAMNDTYGFIDTDIFDGHSDVDMLFIEHNFFSDDNANDKWDDGEMIGYANYWPVKDPPREKQPPIPGSAFQLSVEDNAGSPLEEEEDVIYSISVFFDDSFYDYSYDSRINPEEGLLWTYIPPDCSLAEINAKLPGYMTDPLVLDPTSYWANVTSAQENGTNISMTHSFIMEENHVPLPTMFTAEQVNGSANVSLAWVLPSGVDEVIVLRGIEFAPTSPETGMLVYQGSGTAFQDTTTIEGYHHHYSIFSVSSDPDDISEGKTISLMVNYVISEEDGDGNGGGDPGNGGDGDGGDGGDGDGDDDGLPTALIAGVVALIILVLVAILIMTGHFPLDLVSPPKEPESSSKSDDSDSKQDEIRETNEDKGKPGKVEAESLCSEKEPAPEADETREEENDTGQNNGEHVTQADESSNSEKKKIDEAKENSE